MPEFWPGLVVILIIGALFVPSIGIFVTGMAIAGVGMFGVVLAIIYGLILSCWEWIGCLFGKPRPTKEVVQGLL